MEIVRYVFSRLVKLIGNLLKGIFYVVHLVRPSLRLEIPLSSKGLISSNRNRLIPRIVWQTNYTRSVTLPIYANYLFNRLLAPTHEFRMLVDSDIEDFIRANYSCEILKAYLRLQIGAAKADFWRLLALKKMGGVYIDIDANLVWPLELIIGPDDEEIFLNERGGLLTNYFFASSIENRHISDLVAQVGANIATNELKSVFNLTGPEVFRHVLNDRPVKRLGHRTVCHQGNFTNEYFQYIDKPSRKWHREEQIVDVLRD
jgi:mannosyltransferase OCH1-like enzyme